MSNHQLQWQYQPGQQLSLSVNDLPLWSYCFSTSRHKPFFHPLCTPGGIELTAFEPSDHIWHRGLWFSWKYLNGVNYWEENETGPEGRMRLIEEQLSIEKDAASHRAHYEYLPGDGAPILDETRILKFHTPQNAFYCIDWDLHWRARTQVVFDRTPITEETPWGGYAGLSWRAARSLTNFKALSSEGAIDEGVEHSQARWVDFSAQSDGGWNKWAGLAMFDHPANARHPSHWRCILESGFGFISPSFVMHEPFKLSAGERLNLRYRVLVHDGRADAAMLQQEYRKFREQSFTTDE